MSHESKFADCHDLIKLKYFKLDAQDRLILRKEEAERAIDFHTHLGMSFLFGRRINLFRKTERVEYFFPDRGLPIDPDVYSTFCIPPERAKKTLDISMFALDKAVTDRTIAHAIKIEGGAPHINWIEKGEKVPLNLIKEMNLLLA